MSISSSPQANVDDYAWQVVPEAARFVDRVLSQATEQNGLLAKLAQRMHDETGTRLVDWTLSITLVNRPETRERVESLGFEAVAADRWQHPGGLFPILVLRDNEPDVPADHPIEVALKVDSIDDFVHAGSGEYVVEQQGKPGDRCQCADVRPLDDHDAPTKLVVVERHGRWTGVAESTSARQIAMAAKHRAAMVARRRRHDDPADGFAEAVRLVQAAAVDLREDWATDLFFAAEREYWQSRNQAARVQYERQQRLGLGWANHDHHTYRSSRQCFHLLVDALEQMGFSCRERFYAGKEAGWGAQVLEHADCGIVIFADVDLSPDEVAGDFAHQPLPERETLGTVGLWCRLHGESFLSAGMHHLECQFDFDAARTQLAAAGIDSMAPFTDFDYLKQAFTQGEMWPVDEERLQSALADGHITEQQAETFRRDGALGSHLEILQRDEGYKGFNQTGISEIITRTDPRNC